MIYYYQYFFYGGIIQVDFVAEIYNFAQLIPAVKEVIENCYAEETLKVKANWTSIQELLVEFCKEVTKKDCELGNEMYSMLQTACSHTQKEPANYNLMADDLNSLIPHMYRAINQFGQVDVSEDDYRIFSSKSGFFTLEKISSNRVFHSAEDPMWEAYICAKRIYSPKYSTFSFIGCGLGYLPWQLFCLSDSSVDIHIFHNDPVIVQYALDYGVLGWIPEDKLHIHIEEDQFKLLDSYSDPHPEWGKIGYRCCNDIFETLNEKAKDILVGFDALNGTETIFKDIVDINLARNIRNVSETFYSFKPKTDCSECLVVVAGPSLDDNLDLIRENVGKKTIICASTVLKKLLSNGIKPDCVTVLDPQTRTYGHFDGLTDESVPILLSSTANWRFGELYKGKKYIVPGCSSEESIAYFKARNIASVDIGTTVSSLAIRIALTLGAKQIDLFGLDLSYPGGKSHASGTMDLTTKSTKGMIEIPCVSGGTVYTTRQFMIYITEIEEMIAKNKQVRFVDYSDIGARFKGVIWHKNL